MKSLYLKSTLLVLLFQLAIPSYAALSYHFNAESGLLTISGTGSKVYPGDVNEAIGRKSKDETNYTLKRVEFVGNTGITSISSFAFDGCVGLASIDLPETLTKIETVAFSNCDLTTLTIPAGVKLIEGSVFSGCKKLFTVICLAATEPEISIYAFDYIPGYGRQERILYVPNASKGFTGSLWKLKSDEAIAYGQYPSDLSYDFNPASGVLAVKGSGTHISSVGVYAALSRTEGTEKNKTLKKIDFSAAPAISYIGASTFINCLELTDIDLPSTLTSIGESTFKGCAGLSSVTLPKTLSFIGDYAFESCSSLSAVTLPENLKTIGGGAFIACTSLPSVSIPDAVTSIGSAAFQSCTALTAVILPLNLNTIKYDTFLYCENLASVRMPESLRSIGSLAFMNCYALTSITLPADLTEIGSLAFGYCDKLKTINYMGDVQPEIVVDAFAWGLSSGRTLYVPNATTGFTASDWGYDVTIKYGEVGAIGCTDNTSFSVAQSGSDLLLKGLPTGTLYTITNTQGQCIEKGMITGETHTISISTNGIYLVSTGGHTLKVAVKI